MTDLGERLREQYNEHEGVFDDDGNMCGMKRTLEHEAADEIERLRKERDELVAALKMVCKIECVDDLWKAQAALAKLGADKTGEK